MFQAATIVIPPNSSMGNYQSITSTLRSSQTTSPSHLTDHVGEKKQSIKNTSPRHKAPTAKVPPAAMPYAASIHNATTAPLKARQEAETMANSEDYRDYSRLPIENLRDPSSFIYGNSSSKEPPFPLKLHEILSNPEYQEIICWLPHGRSWRVLKPRAFEEKIISLHFRHCRYSSFMRQVNGWGFKRVSRGPDMNSYYHELFLRGLPHLSLKMHRLVGGGKPNLVVGGGKAPVPDFNSISARNPLPDHHGNSNDDAILAAANTAMVQQLSSVLSGRGEEGAHSVHLGELMRLQEGQDDRRRGGPLPGATLSMGQDLPLMSMENGNCLLQNLRSTNPHLNWPRPTVNGGLDDILASSSTLATNMLLTHSILHTNANTSPNTCQLDVQELAMRMAMASALEKKTCRHPSVPSTTSHASGVELGEDAKGGDAKDLRPTPVQMRLSSLVNSCPASTSGSNSNPNNFCLELSALYGKKPRPPFPSSQVPPMCASSDKEKVPRTASLSSCHGDGSPTDKNVLHGYGDDVMRLIEGALATTRQ